MGKDKKKIDTLQVTDAFIRHQTYLARYGTGLAKEILTLFADLDLMSFIEKGSIKQVKDKIEKKLNKYRKQVAEKTGKEFKALSKIEIEWISSIMLLSTNRIGSNDEIINDAFEKPLIVTNTTPANLITKSFDRLQEQIANTSFNLQGNAISQSDAELFLKTAFIQFKNSLDAGIRTTVFSVASQAREKAYMANSDIIRGVIMCAVLDGRTTNYCKAIDGEIFKLNEGPRPPFHPRCRTIALPLLLDETDDEAKERLMERVSVGPGEDYVKGDNKAKTTRKNVKDGVIDIKTEVKRNLNYATFLKSQVNSAVGKEFIRDTLGKTRGNLFIDKITNGGDAKEILKEVIEIELNSIDLKGLQKRKNK